jgi:mRNA-degrading endonuclease RelE of RelBE toxin-antitoxin system
MPLILYYYPSFERSLKSLGPEQRKIVRQLLSAVQVYYASDCQIEEAQKIAPRFFYKQLRKPYYEAGIESTLRVIIEREQSRCVAVLAGNHDDIKRFLANE